MTAITMQCLLALASAALLFPPLAQAQHDHGMDGMDDMNTMVGGSMKMYLHLTPGDSVLFGPWVPKSDRAVIGTCVGVFLLAMIDRWFSATSAIMNAYWNKE